MPPKSATNSKRGKDKKCMPEVRCPPKLSAHVHSDSASGLDPEVEDRFELELCWCIQQLEASLVNGKVQEKQAQGLSKHLHSLRSNNVSLIRKRQIMRNTLGDYRDKMAEDERKLSKTVSSVKFTSPAAINKKSMFIKKAVRCSAENLPVQSDHHEIQDASVGARQTVVNINRTETPFQFNFQTC